MNRSLFLRIGAAALASLVGAGLWPCDAPDRVAAQAVPVGRRASVEVWEPTYTGFLRLPGEDAAVALAGGEGGRLWLAAETRVTSFADGVWAVPESPPGVSLVFTLAPAGDTVWAFGLDGGAWRRREGVWRQVPAPLVADMYGSVAPGPDEAWAVGFDYAAEAGVIFHATGQGEQAAVEALTGDWLKHHELHAVGVDPGGRLWIGGCDYASRPEAKTPYAAYRAPDGSWLSVPLPIAEGCIYSLSFDPAGWGLAAAGTELLRWEPGATWQAFGLAPPEGSQWVRVAAAQADPGGSGDGPIPAGWAIAGIPRWNGYSDARSPWHFDGTRWAEAILDDPGLAEAGPGVDAASFQPFIGLATDGARVWSVTRSRPSASPALDTRATLLALEAGRVGIAHPLLTIGAEGDIAALNQGRVWVGTNQGTAPFLEHTPAGWQAVDLGLGAPMDRPGISRISLAGDGTGWALGPVRRGPPGGGPRRDAWRFDGSAWRSAPAPAERASVQLRALPGGQAWSLVSAADGQGELWTSDGGDWLPLAGAPRVAPPPTPPAPAPPAFEPANHAAIRAPMDALRMGEATLGWLAAGPQALYRGLGDRFELAEPGPRGQIIDLQLTGPRSGWAIGVDPRRAAAGLDAPTGVLLRLQDGAWREVPLLAEARLRASLPVRGITDARWLLLSAVSAEEAWLAGYVETERQALRVLVGVNRGRAPLVLVCNAAVLALSASTATGANGQPLGTDIWLLAEGPCGSPADPRLAPRLPGNAGPNPDYAPLHVGPVSRLRVRSVVDQVFLPELRGGR